LRRSRDRRGDEKFIWGGNEYLLLTLNDRKPAAPSAPELAIHAPAPRNAGSSLEI
jgi:hypothetical protein